MVAAKLRRSVRAGRFSGLPAVVLRHSMTQVALPTADQASEIAQLKRENERL